MTNADFMNRPIIDPEEIYKKKDLIRPIYFKFKKEYKSIVQRKNGKWTHNDFNKCVEKAKQKHELSVHENNVVEAFFDSLMFDLTSTGNSILTFKKFDYVLR